MYTRFVELLQENNTTAYKVSKETGIATATLSDWKSGRSTPKQDKLQKIADYFNVSLDYLVGNSDFRNNEELLNHWDKKYNAKELALQSKLLEQGQILPIEKKKIPLLGEVACGKPIFTNEDRESYIEAGTDIQADFCLKAKGDSMINARIFDGDIVFIRQQSAVNNGEIAVVIIDDEATLKRVYYYQESQKLVLTPENPKYEPFVYVGEELNQIHILGKAVAFQSDVM